MLTMSSVFNVDRFVDYNEDVQVMSLQCRHLVKVYAKSKYSPWIFATNKPLITQLHSQTYSHKELNVVWPQNKVWVDFFFSSFI